MCLLASLAAPALAQDPADARLGAGRRLFEEGVLANGAKLSGARADGTSLVGSAAACANCHRPSGMGSVEGDIQVAPISGRFLFPQEGERPLAVMDPRIGKRMSQKRAPHTEASLGQALREGVGSNGQILSPLMPRYALADADLKLVSDYLRQLSVSPSPGVEDRTIRFATVITPGVEPERKKIMLDMLRTAFMQKNGSTVVGNTARRHMVSAAELVLGTENKWALDVWELQGAPDTWAAQLQEYKRLAPPFALLSGISNTTWAPVEAFCESEHIPCWFPSVASAPQRSTPPRYAFYFNKGLPLEAEVLGSYLREQKAKGRLVQIARSSDASLGAADALAKTLGLASETKGLKTTVLDLSQWSEAEMPGKLQQQLKSLTAADTLMLWLRPADLRLLEPVLAQVPAVRVASGQLLGGGVGLMPESLRGNMRLVYPYATPSVRDTNMGYLYVWLKLRRIPIVDLALQSEVYFAVNFLTDTLAEMLDNLYRDYMVERAENMIGQREGRKAEDEMRDQTLVRPRVRKIPMEAGIPQPSFAPGRAEHMDGKREGTTIYPRLNLGPGQRYASKGAYIAHYDASAPDLLVTETPWIVP
ncbi:hypothetical protein DIC66_05205 [Rhodoferax lacus]|uniref:Cytochrome c domain-containing protein n=1 Tax=Rhodoferax lacus TaxID=2184758 RepID=A0A3E1RFH6_9BURK|nr:hypothetical protein DIC66_05205 [Rhodoferax lacus]